MTIIYKPCCPLRWRWIGLGAETAILTNIYHISSPTGVQVQWRIAGRTVLRIELANKLVKASLMADVRTRELKDALSPESVLEGLLADGAFAADKGALSPRAATISRYKVGHGSYLSVARFRPFQDGIARLARRNGRRRSIGRGAAREGAGSDRVVCSTRQFKKVNQLGSPQGINVKQMDNKHQCN